MVADIEVTTTSIRTPIMISTFRGNVLLHNANSSYTCFNRASYLSRFSSNELRLD